MKKLLSYDEFIDDLGLTGVETWLRTQYEIYVDNQRHRMPRNDASKSMYLYGVDASHFNHMVTSQESFVTFRIRYLEHVIKGVLMIEPSLRDDERLQACIKARSWCETLMKEIKE